MTPLGIMLTGRRPNPYAQQSTPMVIIRFVKHEAFADTRHRVKPEIGDCDGRWVKRQAIPGLDV